MRFLNFCFNHMVQKYQNEIAPILYYGISTKTNEKDLKIPNLQPPDWKSPYWMTLYIRSGPSQLAVHIVLSNFVTSWFVFSLCISERVSGAQQCLSSSSYSWSLFSSAPTTMSQNAGKSSTDAGSHSLSRISHLEVGTIGNCLFCPMGHFPSNTG